jgi:hypothetical protein
VNSASAARQESEEALTVQVWGGWSLRNESGVFGLDLPGFCTFDVS